MIKPPATTNTQGWRKPFFSLSDDFMSSTRILFYQAKDELFSLEVPIRMGEMPRFKRFFCQLT
jgi:hypothetical protein